MCMSLITAITCTELAVDCKCHLNTDACEAVDANSECNSDSGSCSCASGFEVDQINGGCLDTAGNFIGIEPNDFHHFSRSLSQYYYWITMQLHINITTT